MPNTITFPVELAFDAETYPELFGISFLEAAFILVDLVGDATEKVSYHHYVDDNLYTLPSYLVVTNIPETIDIGAYLGPDDDSSIIPF